MNLRFATLQRLVVLVLIGLAFAFVAVLQPVARRSADEDGPLRDLAEQLGRATVEAGLPRGTALNALSNRLEALRSASDSFATAVREALPRIEQPPEVRTRLEEPFQLVEFLNESQRRLEELASAAQAARVKLAPGLARGFPRYQPELEHPELLWVQLAMVTRVVRTAIRSGVQDVKQVAVEPLPVLETTEYGLGAIPPPAPRRTEDWATVRMHLVAVGAAEAVGRLLVALTFTPEELAATGLPEELAGRPALFVDHVLLRRDQLEAAERVQVELVVTSVVPTEEP